MKRLYKALREVLFPHNYTCEVCGKEAFGKCVCGECSKSLIFNDKEICPVCGRRTPYARICVECKEKPPLYKKAVSAFVYEGGTVRLIKKFKSGCGYLKSFFAEAVLKRLEGFPEYDRIVYVPVTRRAGNRRGYNQCELLAKAVSKRTGVPVIRRAVEKVKDTEQQKDLSRKARSKNLKGCFSVVRKREVKGRKILVIDDVLTTGATVDEMSKALLKAGAAEVFVVTIASVEYKIIHK